MHLLMLRGKLPPPHERKWMGYADIMKDAADMWTQLLYSLLGRTGATGELVYEVAPEEEGGKSFGNFFVERGVADIAALTPLETPDVIISVGWSPCNDRFVSRFPGALAVYYGKNEQASPRQQKLYQMVLVDSENRRFQGLQATEGGGAFHLFCKPAVNMFKPVDVAKRYHVCILADARKPWKGHTRLFQALAKSGTKILAIGGWEDRIVQVSRGLGADVTWTGWVPPAELPALISQCMIGVCCSTGGIDSSPEMIPKYLACGLPIVITDDVPCWRGYLRSVPPLTGSSCDPSELAERIRYTLFRREKLDPRAAYEQEMSVEKVSEAMAWMIQDSIKRMAG